MQKSRSIALQRTGNRKMADVRQVWATVIVAIICKRRKKKRMVKKVWERKWLRRRTKGGVSRQLLEELRLEEEFNSTFLSSGSPLCQNEFECETILMKICFTCTPFSCKSNSFSYEKFCTKARNIN